MWRRIPFDIDAFRQAIESARLPTEPSYFLRHDPRTGVPPLREVISFSPATSPDESAQNAVEVQELRRLRTRVARYRVLLWLLTTLVATVLAGAMLLWWRVAMRSKTIADPLMSPIAAIRSPVDRNLLNVPRSPFPADTPVPGWRIRIGNKRRQNAEVIRLDDGAIGFHLVSASPRDSIKLSSALVRVAPGMKLCAEATFAKSVDFSGNIALVITLRRHGQGNGRFVDQFVVKEPTVQRKAGWQAKRTFTLPAESEYVEFQIRGKFTGSVSVRDISLIRRN